jgi:hypothetical protein
MTKLRTVQKRIAAGLLLGLALLVACQPTIDEPVRCKSIPDGGCPVRAGVDNCFDRSCAALYRCNADLSWTQTKVCPERPDAGTPDASVIDAVAPRDVTIDAPPGAGGGPGCGDLTLPDCNLLFAIGCPQGCCGCEDVFVCANGGWNTWGVCANGQLTPSQ